jgi:hypothetical protein
MIEKKGEHYGWDNCGNPKIERNYTLFSILANVRDYSHMHYISLPRGLPDDCCNEFESWFKHWDTDAHSCSWVSLQEMKDFDMEAYEYYNRLAWDKLISKMELIGEDTRLVFFFDN